MLQEIDILEDWTAIKKVSPRVPYLDISSDVRVPGCSLLPCLSPGVLALQQLMVPLCVTWAAFSVSPSACGFSTCCALPSGARIPEALLQGKKGGR